MPVIITAIPDEPIILSTIHLPLHLDSGCIQHLNHEIADLIDSQQSCLYHICQFQENEPLCFSDILLWIAEQHDDFPGSVIDPRAVTILVGEGPMFHLWRKKIYQRLGTTIMTFATLAEALMYARAEINRSDWGHQWPYEYISNLTVL